MTATTFKMEIHIQNNKIKMKEKSNDFSDIEGTRKLKLDMKVTFKIQILAKKS